MVVSLIIIAAAVAIAAYLLFPDQTQRFFEIAWTLKGWMLTLLGIGFVLAFLSTGNPLLILAGMAGVALFVWYALYEMELGVEVNA